jgi:hypothetical protein
VKSVKHFVLSTLVVFGSVSLAIAQTEMTHVTPNALDFDAARNAKIYRHAMPAQNQNGSLLRAIEPKTGRPRTNASAPATALGHNRFPGDLSYNGGAVVKSIESHGVFINSSKSCPVPQCWGAPLAFLTDLGKSNFIHVTDQYVGDTASDRYTVGPTFFTSFAKPKTPLTDASMAAIAHAVASKGGFSGYGHIVHLFLPPNQDVCFDSTFSVCYSPDNSPTFFFCAYHSSADFTDIGHVLYSVEPYQNVPGCQVKPGTPNGALMDSTNNVLSHELIEAITDPDGSAWFNTANLDNLFAEIGDECSFVSVAAGAFDPSVVQLNGHLYAIQPEYSNQGHVCATGLK